MRIYTTHVKPGAAPILLREAFSWGAVLFGPLYFAVNRAWIPAAFSLAASVLIGVLTPPAYAGPLSLGFLVIQGFLARDALRWSLAQRGYTEGPVVAAASGDEALARFLAARPDLISSAGLA
jgi:hypothetical protein